MIEPVLRKLQKLFRFKKKTGGVLCSELERAIGYNFRDKAFLKLALTHSSSTGYEDKKGLLSNERLEFLGDAVLDLIVTEHLYHKHPKSTEGRLSGIKSLLVSRKILGEIGRSINLGKYIKTETNNDRKILTDNNTSVVSNTFEALIGGVYLDSGLLSAKSVLERVLLSNIDDIIFRKDNINYKSRILEITQEAGLGIPVYPLIKDSGPDHKKVFEVGIEVCGVRIGRGSGKSKKQAQQKAAQEAVENYTKEEIMELIKKERK
ncbi:MAG: ribonuclease III [Chitinivibrionales bacterium]